MTETATEIYCRLNNVQEIQSEMDATNENRCFRIQTDSAGGVCVCVLSGFLFFEDIYQAVVSLLIFPLNTISQVLLTLSSFPHRSNVGNS